MSVGLREAGAAAVTRTPPTVHAHACPAPMATRPRRRRGLRVSGYATALGLITAVILLWPDLAHAAADPLADLAQPLSPEDAAPASGASTALRILVMMTLLSLLPAAVMTMTCFTRIVIVFSFLRQALGVQGMPPNQVMTGMALFLTLFVMAPVGERIHTEAIVPAQSGALSTMEAIERGAAPLSEFMLQHTQDRDLLLFYEVSGRDRPASRADVSFFVLVPAFTLSEVRTAFEMGFLILVPFLVIDLIVSSILMAMGMVMLPPALIAMPVKILVFVLADGWALIIGSLIRSLSS